MQDLINKANIIVEALPYISKLAGKFVVIKYGGNAMNDPVVVNSIMQDVATLKMVGVNPILVHGGGPEINALLDKLNIKVKFKDGLRVTDAATMEAVQMALCGKLNKNIASSLCALGVKAIGLSGKDAGLIQAVKKSNDLGYVGKITGVNISVLTDLCTAGYVPVIAGIGADSQGNSYNINADTAAGDIAAALRAEKLIFLTDIDGIRKKPSDPKTLIPEITVAEIKKLIKDGTIEGGMIPKAEGCIRGVEQGINRVHIINGTVRHSILLEIFTDTGIGTVVTK
ncbi:MAG: acetylglutamate kinase [Firmicutes bacterium]|nr:acetylglutamate kinase [Bacillota bacterium]